MLLLVLTRRFVYDCGRVIFHSVHVSVLITVMCGLECMKLALPCSEFSGMKLLIVDSSKQQFYRCSGTFKHAK